MNAAEIKLELFRKIDSLKDDELEKVYKVFLSLLTPGKKYVLTKAERKAVNEALEYSKRGETFTHETVMKEAQTRYPELRLK
jgi:hypothetical protein